MSVHHSSVGWFTVTCNLKSIGIYSNWWMFEQTECRGGGELSLIWGSYSEIWVMCSRAVCFPLSKGRASIQYVWAQQQGQYYKHECYWLAGWACHLLASTEDSCWYWPSSMSSGFPSLLSLLQWSRSLLSHQAFVQNRVQPALMPRSHGCSRHRYLLALLQSILMELQDYRDTQRDVTCI